jgi:hypothetical protein
MRPAYPAGVGGPDWRVPCQPCKIPVVPRERLRFSVADGTVRTPFKRHRHRPRLSRRQRAVATLKSSKILTTLRCCPRRATAIVQAIIVLHHIETNRYSR